MRISAPPSGPSATGQFRTLPAAPGFLDLRQTLRLHVEHLYKTAQSKSAEHLLRLQIEPQIITHANCLRLCPRYLEIHRFLASSLK